MHFDSASMRCCLKFCPNLLTDGVGPQKRKTTKQGPVISPRAYRPPRHIPPASPNLAPSPALSPALSPACPPRHFTVGGTTLPPDPNQAQAARARPPSSSRPIATSPASAATAAAIAAAKQSKQPKASAPDLIQLNFPDAAPVATSRDNGTSGPLQQLPGATRRHHDSAAQLQQPRVAAKTAAGTQAERMHVGGASHGPGGDGQLHVGDAPQGPVAVFSSRAAAAIAAARLWQLRVTQQAQLATPVSHVSHTYEQKQQQQEQQWQQQQQQQQQDLYGTSNGHQLGTVDPAVGKGARERRTDQLRGAVTLPRPGSAPAASSSQQHSRRLHTAAAASNLRPRSAAASDAAASSSQQHKAYNTSASAPRLRRSGAASSTGRVSNGLAASANAVVKAASRSSIHGTAHSRQMALPSSSDGAAKVSLQRLCLRQSAFHAFSFNGSFINRICWICFWGHGRSLLMLIMTTLTLIKPTLNRLAYSYLIYYNLN